MDQRKIIMGAVLLLAAGAVWAQWTWRDRPEAPQGGAAASAMVQKYPSSQEALEDIDHELAPVREQAVLAYARRSVQERTEKTPIPPERIQPLLGRLRNDPNPAVRAAAATGLGTLGALQSVEPLGKSLEDPDPRVQQRAKHAIARITGITLNFEAGDSKQKRQRAIRFFHEVVLPEVRAQKAIEPGSG
ncbi:MAG: HEAT repeat domain-containing protein [Phycisphaeraceae bacterium]|nr:HEAT repeat domain-containing protein [Phycisphaeraceae bacterium]